MRTRIPPPVIGIFAAFLIWALDQWLPGARIDFPGRHAAALSLWLASLLIEVLSIGHFLKARTTVNPMRPERAATLVTSGIYRLTRNPMYVSLAGLLLGWAVWLGNPTGLIVIALFVALMNRVQIIPEERALAAKFGDDYAAYKARVRRWL